MQQPNAPAGQSEQPRLVSKQWHPFLALSAIAFIGIVFLATQLASVLLLSIYGALHGWSESQTYSWLQNSVAGQFMFVLLTEAFSVASIVLALRAFKVKLSTIGLRRPKLSDPLYGFAIAPLYFITYVLIVTLAKALIPQLDVNQKQMIGFTNVHGGLQLGLTFLSLVVLPPIAEEIMMRGFLYTALKKNLNLIAAVLLTSTIFAAAHLPEGGSGGLLYIGAIDTFVLSLFLIYLREKTGGLWASITLHAIKNGIAFVALFVLHMQ